jgi:perosamine synthetase
VADMTVKMIGLDIRDSDVEAVSGVLRSGMIAQGPEVAALEKAFCEKFGTKYAVAVNSGTAALHCLLGSLQMKPGDEVITTSLSFAATANMIIAAGGTPRCADVDEKSMNLDPQSVKARVTPKTRAILAVDLFGRLADYAALQKVAGPLPIFADACQSIGAKDANGRFSGGLAAGSAFSLYATKNWQCGEGGIVSTDDEQLALFCRRFRHHGQAGQSAYDYQHLGFNYRLTDFTARFARSQLELLDGHNRRRLEIAERYTKGLAGVDGIILPEIVPGHCVHQYTLRAKDRDKLRAWLQERGVMTQIYYPKALTTLPHLGEHVDRNSVPVATRLSQEVVSIPVHGLLTDAQIDYVITNIKQFYAE